MLYYKELFDKKKFPYLQTFVYLCTMNREIQYFKNYFIDFYN